MNSFVKNIQFKLCQLSNSNTHLSFSFIFYFLQLYNRILLACIATIHVPLLVEQTLEFELAGARVKDYFVGIVKERSLFLLRIINILDGALRILTQILTTFAQWLRYQPVGGCVLQIICLHNLEELVWKIEGIRTIWVVFINRMKMPESDR